MFSAVPPIADIPWSGPLKAHVVRETVTLARRRKIRTLSKLQRKLLRSPFGFQNCTKMTKYEALEKNVVSNRKLPSLRQSLVRSVTQKVSVCWGFWGWSTVIDSRLPRSMAEREGFEQTVRLPLATRFGFLDPPRKGPPTHRLASYLALCAGRVQQAKRVGGGRLQELPSA
jgi:hypothetical protein